MENCADFSVFLQAFANELWLTKKKKEGQNGLYVAELLDCMKD